VPEGWPKHVVLFVATLLSVFLSGALQQLPADAGWTVAGVLANLHRGWTFAVPLMAILLTHELGHYFAAVYHRVPASLPYFIPLPILSPFGTMGAVIAMPGRIRSRNALLDIGAAGPLAGMVVAAPVLLVGLAQSPVRPITGSGLQEGQCLLYWLFKRLAVGPIPEGHDVFLTPTAFAGWAGLLVTMLNLLPIGQLDGGHIAYALFGEKHDRIAPVLFGGLLVAFGYNYLAYRMIEPGLVWLVWFVLLFLMRRISGGNHPSTEPGALSPGRRWIAIGCLVLFVLLFMPTPLRAYGDGD
jgi:membrane-associated protease RseP (regulator of RpoE activity)